MHTPSTFQACLEECLWLYIDEFLRCFLDDILIYSTKKEEHIEQLRKMLTQLLQDVLNSKSEMCRVAVTEVGLLGFVISPKGIAIESDRI